MGHEIVSRNLKISTLRPMVGFTGTTDESREGKTSRHRPHTEISDARCRLFSAWRDYFCHSASWVWLPWNDESAILAWRIASDRCHGLSRGYPSRGINKQGVPGKLEASMQRDVGHGTNREYAKFL